MKYRFRHRYLATRRRLFPESSAAIRKDFQMTAARKIDALNAARTIAKELGQNPDAKGTARLAEDLMVERTLSKAEEAYIARAAAFFIAGGNDWQGGDGWGFWFANGTMSFGASSWCCKNAHAQTIAKCRGDGINALRRLYIAGKNRELGAECVIV